MSNESQGSRVVILVHGLYMHGRWMALLRRRLARVGHATRVFNYPSLADSVETNADALAAWLAGVESERVDFVAHSLGGLIVRSLFHRHPAQRPGRVVTLGTPHQASFVARWLAGHGLGVALGRARARGLLGELPPWDGPVELGSVAGSRGLGIGRLIPALPLPNDGTVALEETKLEGMTDHVVLPVTHTGLLVSKRVADHCDQFLRRGCFAASHRVARPRPNP